MEQILTFAFDGITVEELTAVCPPGMTAELDPAVFLRIQNRVLKKLDTESDKADEPQVKHPSPSTRNRKRLARTLLIAAVIALVAAVGAVALSLGGGRFLAALIGGDNYDLVQQYIMADLASVNDGRLNLTLESALSDGHYYFVVFSVSSLDESDLGDRFPDVEFSFDLETPSRVKPGFQLERLETEENTGSFQYYLASIHSSQSVIRSMRMDISRMFSFDGSLDDIPASLSAEAGFTPCPIAVGGETAGAFQNIELSPFGLWIDVFEAWEGSDTRSDGLPLYDVFLLYEDGSKVGARAEQFANPDYMEELGWGGVQMPNGTHQSYISIRFARFVDISKVKAVIIHGQEYPLNMGGN